MPVHSGKEQPFNFGIRNNDEREADIDAEFLVTINTDGTHGKILKSTLIGLIGVGNMGFNRLVSPQQNFTIPAGKTAIKAEVNGTPYYISDSTNASEFNTFTQSGTTVSFTNTLETGEYLRIFYQ